ncbi:hypothetical protein TYRP_008652 [Tyrophagus putrescentiae]|nr:hypothetical protein TYRP_008652 [Tyrophagus putrescentiae]
MIIRTSGVYGEFELTPVAASSSLLEEVSTMIFGVLAFLGERNIRSLSFWAFLAFLLAEEESSSTRSIIFEVEGFSAKRWSPTLPDRQGR